MLDIRIDVRSFESKARDMGAAIDQMPFAISVALNEAVKKARMTLIDQTWPKGVTVRNRTFMRAALRIEFANKHNLRAAVFDSLGRASLKLHAEGGVKRARGTLAIPSQQIKAKRTGKDHGRGTACV